MNGLFIPGITAEMFRNGCLESIDALMADGEIYDIDYSTWIPVSERLPEDGAWAIFTDGSTISVERYKADAIDHFYPQGRWFSFDKATAWQPLPKPYKAEREETKDWVDKEMAKNYGFVLREEDRSKIRTSGASFLEEVGGEIGSSCEKFIRQMTGNEGGEE